MPNRPPIHHPPGYQAGQRAYDRSPERADDRRFYAGTAWQAVRRDALLRDLYQCRTCGRSIAGKREAHVDHLISRRLRPDLEYSLDNLISLCVPCHSRKTAHVDGGFGHART